MTYKILIQQEAELDLQDAFNWYESNSRGLGSEFIRAIDASLSQIQRNPFAYQVVYRELRRKLIRRFPYGIFYLIESETIYVIACFHVKRSPQHWRRRLDE
ncbi:MAG: type II toxin-antitoxin system RelE/ParE family toxin [Cyanobacteria bacterium P01_A01_bin.83]